MFLRTLSIVLPPFYGVLVTIPIDSIHYKRIGNKYLFYLDPVNVKISISSGTMTLEPGFVGLDFLSYNYWPFMVAQT